MGVGSKARFVGREEAPRRDRYLDYAEGKTRQFKPGSFARAGALPIALPVTACNPRPVPIIMVVVVISIIMAVVAVPVVTTTVIISRGRSWGETGSTKQRRRKESWDHVFDKPVRWFRIEV